MSLVRADLEVGVWEDEEPRWVAVDDDEAVAALRADDFRDGSLVIRQGDVETRIRDNLDALAAHICFGTRPQLLAGEHAVVPYVTRYGYVRFDPEGDDYLVSGDELEPRRFDAAGLPDRLFQAGRRFLDLVRRANADGSLDGVVELLEEAEAEAEGRG